MTTATKLWTIDADTHIHETEDTWEWLREDEAEFRPTTGFPPNQDPKRPETRYWMVDGRRRPRATKTDSRAGTPVAADELLDPELRVRHMDELGTEVQIIYPTLFLVEVSDKPRTEYALKRTYNRWLADRTQKSGGRLRWVCLPALTDIEKSLEEIRFAKANGACAVMKKGDREGGHWVNEEYFFPIYEECQKLDLPIVFHIGAGVPDFTPAREFPWGRFAKLGAPVLHGFYNLVMFGTTAKFPNLRWGFIEAGSSWVPYLCYDIKRRLERQTGGSDAGYTYDKPSDIVTKNNFYITCQVDEDLPYILNYTTEDNLIVGSDYTHGDSSSEIDFPAKLQARVDKGDISAAVMKKIAYDNGKRFYGV